MRQKIWNSVVTITLAKFKLERKLILKLRWRSVDNVVNKFCNNFLRSCTFAAETISKLISRYGESNNITTLYSKIRNRIIIGGFVFIENIEDVSKMSGIF